MVGWGPRWFAVSTSGERGGRGRDFVSERGVVLERGLFRFFGGAPCRFPTGGIRAYPMASCPATRQ